MKLPLLGSCLCENVRYEVRREPLDVAYCHCTICRRASGAYGVAWLTVPLSEFQFTQGSPKTFQSTPKGLRHFCGECGSALTFRYLPKSETVDVTLATITNLQEIKPQYHIFVETCPSWFQVEDGCPRYEGRGPDNWT